MGRVGNLKRGPRPLFVVAALFVTLVYPGRVQVTALDPSSEPRVMQWDLTYLGGFRLPDGATDAQSFDFGGTALAYNPQNNSLFLVGDDQFQQVAEVNIPTPVISATQTLTDLPITTLVQPFGDVLAGQINAIGSGTAMIGGLLPYGSQMIVTAFLYYDGTGSQTASHFVGSTNLNSGSVNGPYTVSNSLGLAGFVSGWMSAIPTEWQSLLGGPYLTGQCCLAIISRTSLGPSVTVFDPTQLGSASPVPGTTVLGYPISNPTLGAWSSNSTVYNGTTSVVGMVFPPGTRSVLFFGHQGTGPFCYGAGTSDPTLNGQPTGQGDNYCYDPAFNAKGVHGYPYVHQVWAYDANDLAAVKAGTKNPWDLQPYATWTFDLPFQNIGALTGGVAYDPATQRLFIADQGAETTGYDFRPVIHVFQLTAGSPAPTFPPPAAPIRPSEPSTPTCATPIPYPNAQGTEVCVNGQWLPTAQVGVTATVELLTLSSSVSIWALVGEHGTIYTPLRALSTTYRSKGARVTISGTLRPAVRSPIPGGVTIDLSSISF